MGGEMIKNIEYLKILVFEDGRTAIEKANDEIKLLKKELAALKKVNDELLTPNEAAKFLKLPSAKRLSELRSQGKLPINCYVKIDGIGYRYKKRELYKWAKLQYD